MSLMKKLALLAILTCASSFTLAGAEMNLSDERTASERVAEYKALRKACAITRGEQRQECFAQLNAATEDYKRAKKALAMEQPAQDQVPVIGQAQ